MGQHVFAKENECNRQLSSVQELSVRYTKELLRNPLWCVRSYKHCFVTKGQWRYTTSRLLQLPWAWIYGLAGSSFKFFLLFILTLFSQPKFFQVISALLWKVTKSQGRVKCDSLPPPLSLSGNPFRNKLCKHISEAIHYILAPVKNSSTGLLTDMQAKRNILQAS